jgi:isocitrate dehydrogenase (NAD+)
MFKEELDAAARRHPEVEYLPLLIDATFALLLKTGGEAMVIPALNRDGDLLSDLVLQMFGSIAGSESLVLAFDQETLQVQAVMAEAPHGTAPTLYSAKILPTPLP